MVLALEQYPRSQNPSAHTPFVRRHGTAPSAERRIDGRYRRAGPSTSEPAGYAPASFSLEAVTSASVSCTPLFGALAGSADAAPASAIIAAPAVSHERAFSISLMVHLPAFSTRLGSPGSP